MDIDKFTKELRKIYDINLLTEESFKNIKENIKENIKKTQS